MLADAGQCPPVDLGKSVLNDRFARLILKRGSLFPTISEGEEDSAGKLPVPLIFWDLLFGSSALGLPRVDSWDPPVLLDGGSHCHPTLQMGKLGSREVKPPLPWPMSQLWGRDGFKCCLPICAHLCPWGRTGTPTGLCRKQGEDSGTWDSPSQLSGFWPPYWPQEPDFPQPPWEILASANTKDS